MADQSVLLCLHPQLLANRTLSQSSHYIVMDWAHVLVIVQCQTDGCSLSCKDGAIVWQSFGKLAASCLILEIAVDDRRCPHSLVHFGAISADFIISTSAWRSVENVTKALGCRLRHEVTFPSMAMEVSKVKVGFCQITGKIHETVIY